MTSNDIKKILSRLGGLFVPEFTFGDRRIDAVIVEPRERAIRGFEIKVSRSDFLGDSKWQLYSEFCSSLSIVCPEGVIQLEEVPKQFGLMWIRMNGEVNWRRTARRFNRRDALAWQWRYMEVLEREMPRLLGEIQDLKFTVQQLRDGDIIRQLKDRSVSVG